jgi:peptidoglycan/LPS O-acetylase OafA/YrhL
MFLTLILFGLGCSISAISRFRELRETQLRALTTSVSLALLGLLAAYVFLSDEYSRPLWVMVGIGPALLAMAKRMQSDRTA